MFDRAIVKNRHGIRSVVCEEDRTSDSPIELSWEKAGTQRADNRVCGRIDDANRSGRRTAGAEAIGVAYKHVAPVTGDDDGHGIRSDRYRCENGLLRRSDGFGIHSGGPRSIHDL